MERIETSKLNRGLKEVLDEVAKGKSFILTRYGKDVARLGPPYGARAFEGQVQSSTPFDTVEPPKTAQRIEKAQSARDELLSKIRSRK